VPSTPFASASTARLSLDLNHDHSPRVLAV
jgi:hypothetical protein